MRVVKEWPILEYMAHKDLTQAQIAIKLVVSKSAICQRIKSGGFHIVERKDGYAYPVTVKGC